MRRNFILHCVWVSMKQRCHNEKSTGYHNYGGRGIKVCERWLDSFENFLADMGPRPSRQHQLDRIDNDGPYSPQNCRWATRSEQLRNTRRSCYLTFNGQTLHIIEWAARLGVEAGALRARLRRGWSVKKTLTKPLRDLSDKRYEPRPPALSFKSD